MLAEIMLAHKTIKIERYSYIFYFIYYLTYGS